MLKVARWVTMALALNGCAHEVYFGGHAEYVEPRRKPNVADDIAWMIYMARGFK